MPGEIGLNSLAGGSPFEKQFPAPFCFLANEKKNVQRMTKTEKWKLFLVDLL